MDDYGESGKSLHDATGIPFILIDTCEKPLKWNEAAKNLFPKIAKFNEHIISNVTPEEALRFRYLIADRVSFFTFDFPVLKNGESGTWIRLIRNRLANGNYLAVFADITDAKRKEFRLKEEKESAEKASISRSQFMANISHEIRTPIQTIIGMMELLVDTKLDEEQTEYVRQVRFSADVMLTLINDVLDFSKVEAGQLKIENIEFDLSDVIERSVDLVSMEAHKKGIEICIDISPNLPAIVKSDPGRLQQVLLNLVKNSVKFTSKGYILVTASPVMTGREQGNTIRFEVSDTGIGIQGDAQKKLFTQFFQADASTTRKYGGTGLGLAISRNIVELMGGTIGVKNNEPHGATFWFEIPLLRVQEQPAPALLPLETKTRFLIVDDNELTLSLLYTMLNSLGYSDITGATSGKIALDALRSARTVTEPFDIVLIDMIMPEMDGWRLAAEINKNREINQAQLYLMVPEGSFGADAKMKLLEWFNGYLYKPIKRRKLVELLRERRQTSIDLEIVEELESPDGEPLRETNETAQESAITGTISGRGASGTATSDMSGAHASGMSGAHASASSGAQVPQAENEMDAHTSGDAQEQPAKGLVVLIAEDHPVNRKLLKIFLEKAGATVITAEDGQEATEKMGSAPIDLIFMDIQMPRLNGYEATSWIRKRGYTLPVIACTASAQENEKEQCLLFGMTDILPKPYKKQEVIDIMLKYTRKKTEVTMENPDMSVFDNQSFFDIMMGDTDTAKILMGEFLEQTEAHLEILEEDIETGLYEDAGKTAHMIKGSALNITAKRLADASLVIEKNALTYTKEQLEAALARMRDELVTLRARLVEEGYNR